MYKRKFTVVYDQYTNDDTVIDLTMQIVVVGSAKFGPVAAVAYMKRQPHSAWLPGARGVNSEYWEWVTKALTATTDGSPDPDVLARSTLSDQGFYGWLREVLDGVDATWEEVELALDREIERFERISKIRKFFNAARLVARGGPSTPEEVAATEVDELERFPAWYREVKERVRVAYSA